MSEFPSSSPLERELSEAGDGLGENEDVLRSVLSGCGDCIKILDLDGRLLFMSEGGKRVMEVEDFSNWKNCLWTDLWTGTTNDDARLAVAKAKAGGVASFKGAADTAKGDPRHWDVQVSPIFGSDGLPRHLLSISRDITAEWRANADLKEAIERQELLSGELQHRIKNTLAMIGAIARQTIRGDSTEVARGAFEARLMSLSRAHDILMQTRRASAPIKEVVEGALAAHRSGEGIISATGDDFQLLPKQAFALSIAVHELATNAVKYGSLSGRGNVEITWSNNELIDSQPSFRFLWIEKGGPEVTEPAPTKKGFGSRLIERLLANDFAGKVNLSYRPDGVVCELVAPLKALRAKRTAFGYCRLVPLHFLTG